jgi:hypothetical protein
LYTKLKSYKSKIIIRKNRTQKDVSKKLEKEPLRDYKTALALSLRVLDKKKDLAMILGFYPKFDLKMKVKVKYHNRFL